MARIVRINDLKTENVAIFCAPNENQLKRIYEPAPGLFIAESQKVIERALDAGYEAYAGLFEEDKISNVTDELLNRLGDVTIYVADKQSMLDITGYNFTGGALCAFRRKKQTELDDVLLRAKKIAVMEHVENPTNLGAIFRSAAALNIDAVTLSGDCTDPLYRRAIRVSMGNVFLIPWTFFGDTPDDWYGNGIKKLSEFGFTTMAMALSDNAIGLDNEGLKGHEKVAIIMGTEGDGLQKSTIDASDYVVKIPMSNNVDSLNVAAASAVAFWQLAVLQ